MDIEWHFTKSKDHFHHRPEGYSDLAAELTDLDIRI